MIISRPMISFCWLPPDRACAATSGPGVRTSKAAMSSRVLSRAPLRLSQKPWREYGSLVWWPHMAFSHRGAGSSRAPAVTVLGDVADTGLAALAHRPVADVGALQEDAAPHQRADAQQRFHHLDLAVALHAGHPEDLALADLQVDAPHDLALVVVDDDEVPHLQSNRFLGRARLGARLGKLRADHQLRQVPGGDLVRRDRSDGSSGAQHRDGVGDFQHLVEFVVDEDDRFAAGAHVAHVAEQLLHLVGHQHGRGLVEDEDPGTPEQHLDDLHALALSNPRFSTGSSR